MLKTLVFLVLAGALQNPVEAFKKEMTPLQAEVAKAVGDTGAQVMSPPKAAFLEGYGVVVSVSVALEPPASLFSSSGVAGKDEVIRNVTRRQKDVKDKLTAMVKQRVTSMESVGAEESLTIVVHLENYNPRDVPNLPRQLIFSVTKSSPQTPSYKEI